MSIIQTLRERRAQMRAALEALLTEAETREKPGLTDEESARFDADSVEIRKLDERIAELQEQEVRDAAAAKHRVESLPVEERVNERVTVTSEANPVYRRGDRSTSWFADMARVSNPAKFDNIQEARQRLVAAQETRAGDMTSVAGAGGEFAPPLWLTEDFVALARPGRITADLLQKETLPKGVSSINLPKVASGATTAVQATQNVAVSDTAMTTTSVSSGITSIAGKQIVSLQLLEQSGIPFDRVILGDLAKDYAKQLNSQVISGSGSSGQLRGLQNGSGVGSTTYTTTTPAVVSTTSANSFYNRLVAAKVAVETGLYLPATHIVMTPARWGWVLEALDSQNRPLVVPNGPQFNGVAVSGEPVAQGYAGTMHGLPVYVDPVLPQNLGVATNQDIVIVMRADECWLYESPLQSASFDATYADQMSILFRVNAYSALITDRYGPAVNIIGGTGLVAPTL